MKSMAMKKNTILGGDDVVANVGYSAAGLSEKPKEEYPICLKLYLGPDEIKMLGITELPEISSELELEAKVKVVGISKDERGSRLELQITDMSLESEKDNDEPIENIMYGEAKEG
jgi:hypothetical protein